MLKFDWSSFKLDFFLFSSTEEQGKFVEPEILKFTKEDAVKSPYGDPKNIPFTDDNIIIITDYQVWLD